MNDTLGFILFIVARLLELILIPIFIVWGIIESIIIKKLGDYFKSLALIIDVMGNVFGKYMMNRLLITKEGYSFGSRFETISYVLGKNKKLNTLTKLGIFIGKILNKIDKNHLEKADNNEGRN